MTQTGWLEHEMPVSRELRSVAEILAQPLTSREERDAERRERAEAEGRRARAQDAADVAAAEAFRAQMAGRPPRDRLAEARQDPFRDTEAASRRRAAIGILKRHGLADVITGGASGVVIDPNVGVLEPVQDPSQRAELDREYESGRSERIAAEGRAIVNQARAKLDERLRARGLQPSGVSHRSRPADDYERRRYEAACAEIGQPVTRGLSYR